jgi:catechol 2,3-dioxygenase-like lactoylglutathione lyase family enzyme
MSTEAPQDRRPWPEHLRPGALRFARSSSNYDQTIPFYRDVLGLPIVGEFADSFGEDGTIFGLPDTHIQLEIRCADGSGATPVLGCTRRDRPPGPRWSPRGLRAVGLR